MRLLGKAIYFPRRLFAFFKRIKRTLRQVWKNEIQKESAETLLRELANKDQIDLDALRHAAKIYQKYNFPEKDVQELAKKYSSNLRQTAEDLQTLQTLISSGAILRFRIIKTPQESTDLQYVLAGDDETGYFATTSREETLAVLQDKYRAPGISSPAARFKRRAPRFASPHKLVVAFKENDKWVEAEVRNISRTGLLIETGRSISAYKRIKLRLKNTKTSNDVFVSGKIVRRDESDKMQDRALARFGVAFEKKLSVHPRAFLQFEQVEAVA